MAIMVERPLSLTYYATLSEILQPNQVQCKQNRFFSVINIFIFTLAVDIFCLYFKRIC